MAKKKEFKMNVLDGLHDQAEVRISSPIKDTVIQKDSIQRKRITFFINPIFEKHIGKGKLEEKFDSKSDFIEHILNEYFKDKPYVK